MSEDNKSYQKPDIRFHDQPHNAAGMEFLGIKLDSIDVSEWHPLPDGQGKPTQVHVSMMIEGLDVPLVMRFKGPGTLDALISALAVHRFHVWPDRDDTAFQEALDQAEIPAQVMGDDTFFEVYFTDAQLTDYRSTLSADSTMIRRFNHLLLERGILKADQKFYMSLAHTEDDIQRTIEVFREVAQLLR